MNLKWYNFSFFEKRAKQTLKLSTMKKVSLGYISNWCHVVLIVGASGNFTQLSREFHREKLSNYKKKHNKTWIFESINIIYLSQKMNVQWKYYINNNKKKLFCMCNKNIILKGFMCFSKISLYSGHNFNH